MPLKTMDQLSPDTTNLIQETIKRKVKKDRFERSRNMSLTIACILLLLLFFVLSLEGIFSMSNPFGALAVITENNLYVIIIVIIAVLYGYFYYCQTKFKKEKDKLNKVRKELIDHLNDSKNMNLQDQAGEIKKLMKAKHDINLYVKNK